MTTAKKDGEIVGRPVDRAISVGGVDRIARAVAAALRSRREQWERDHGGHYKSGGAKKFSAMADISRNGYKKLETTGIGSLEMLYSLAATHDIDLAELFRTISVRSDAPTGESFVVRDFLPPVPTVASGRLVTSVVAADLPDYPTGATFGIDPRRALPGREVMVAMAVHIGTDRSPNLARGSTIAICQLVSTSQGRQLRMFRPGDQPTLDVFAEYEVHIYGTIVSDD